VAAEDSGDIAEGAVGIVEVSEGDSIFGLQFVEGVVVGVVAAFAVSDGHTEDLAAVGGRGEGRVSGLGAQVDVAADELQAAIADEGAWQKTSLDEDLEAVTDSQDEAAIPCKLADGAHHGRELGDGSAAEIVAIGEASGKDDGV